MKKILSVLFASLLCVGLILGAASCKPKPPVTPDLSQSAPESSAVAAGTPSSTVNKLFAAFKAFDDIEMRKHVTEPKSSNTIVGKKFEFEVNDAEDKADLDLVRRYTKTMSWVITGETISGDTATVTASLTIANLSDTITQLIGEVTKYAIVASIANKEDDIEDFVENYIRTKIDFENLSPITSDITVHLEKQSDGDWLVVNDSEKNFDMINAISGGVLDQLKELMSYAEKYA